MKKLFTLFLALVASVGTMFAESVKIGDLYYNLDATNQTAEITRLYLGGEYSGDIVIPSSVTYNSNTYSVTSIGESAFEGCSSLISVTISNSVTSIGAIAFRNCSGLTSVTMGNGVTSIGDCAFSGCSSLTSITIPNSVTSIVNSAFPGCSGLTSIIVESGNTVYDSRNNCNAIIETATNALIAGCQSTIIPNSVTSIGAVAFARCSSLTSITIPNSVTSIGSDAFRNCSSLTSVTIGNSVTSIGERAFEDCSSLTSVTIDNSVTSIGRYAFFGCSSLTSVTIPNSVTSIGNYAFYGCDKLGDVYCYATTPPAAEGKDTFSHYNAFLYVPCESKKAYMVDAVWGNFKYIECISSEDIENVLSDQVQCTKVIRNGQIYILRGDKTYTVTGQEVK